MLPAGEIFSTESISIFSEDEDRLPLLAMLNSTVVAEVLQVFGRGRKFENGSVKALPIDRTDVAAANELTATAEALVRAIWSIESIDETSSIFVSPYALATSTSPEKYSSCIKELAAEAQDLQAKVDDVAAGVLGVSEPIDVSIARRPELLKRTIEDGRVGLEQWAGASFSYLVGVAFGRWHADYALGDSYGNPGANLFAPISPSPPGMRRKDGSSEGKGSRVDVPPSGILLDEDGHDWDVVTRLLNASESVFDHPELELDAMLSALGASSVRQHLRRRFFRNHLARYSKSRRKAPIYWPLAVPSRNWGIWVYAPRLSRETLFAVAGEASRREALAAEAIRRLQAERDAGGTGRSTREVSEALGSEEALAEELATFRSEAERLAGLGWEPDLDDGIILCAAPLASFFPAWPDAAKEREQIRKGEYPWATVSRWKDAL